MLMHATPPALRALPCARALSVDAALLRLLRENPSPGVVHSVFDHVVNIQREDGELYTIASRGLDNAPNTLIVNAARFAAIGAVRGDRVDAAAGEIAIAQRIRIPMGGAIRWKAALPAYPSDDSRLRLNLTAMRAQVGPRAFGRAAWTDGSPSRLACAMAAMLERRAAMLRDALRAGEAGSACTHGLAMVGLGPGLTPSGDDFLVGLFAVLHVPASPCSRLKSVCEDIVQGVERRTNAISAAALKAAARGRVRESVQALLRELMAGAPAGVARALSAVLAIGSTSGADMAAGMLCGLEANLQVAGLYRDAG
jgi:hypothetical protein